MLTEKLLRFRTIGIIGLFASFIVAPSAGWSGGLIFLLFIISACSYFVETKFDLHRSENRAFLVIFSVLFLLYFTSVKESIPTTFLFFAIVFYPYTIWAHNRGDRLIEEDNAKRRFAEQRRNEALAQQKKPVEKKPVTTQSRDFNKSNDAQNTSRSIEQISSQEQQCTKCFLFVRNGLTVCPVENPACPHFDKSNDAQNTSPSIEQISNDLVSPIPCASDIVKAQSVSFSPRAPGNVYGLADEMAKVGYRSIGDFYHDIQKIVTHEIEIATVVGKFDLITNNDFLRATLTRMLYAAALGTAKPKDSDLKPLASALRTIVESQKIVPRANGGLSSLEMAELCSAVVVTAIASCQFGSASALMENFNNATLQFADETISLDGPSNRRYITALVLCFLAMVIENSKSISIVTDSLAGNRLVPLDINQLGSIDFNYLNANRPGWLAEVIASSPELQRAYLRYLRDDE